MSLFTNHNVAVPLDRPSSVSSFYSSDSEFFALRKMYSLHISVRTPAILRDLSANLDL